MKVYLVILMSLLCTAVFADELPVNKPKGWLLEAENDSEKFELLQRYLRGFDQPMWEVGERYRSLYEALSRDNYDLATYHWKKIRTTIKNGYLKRPARQANADAILLDKTWQEVVDSFQTRIPKAAWLGFERAKNACMACHVAEGVSYMNNQPLFELSSSVQKPEE